MFAASLGRILWKEYRAHRTLWVACAALGCLFEILIWSVVVDEPIRFSMMSGVPSVLAFCYAAACSALLFASEREERTSNWLLSLSVPPQVLVVGKVSFAILSIIALQLAIAIPSLVGMKGTSQEFVALFAPVGLIGLVWTLFGSLTSRRVLVSIAAMLFWWLFTLLLPMGIVSEIWPTTTVHDGNHVWVEIGIGLLIIASFVVDLWLAWRWSQGRYFDGTIFESFVDRTSNWRERFTLTQWRSRPLVSRVEHEQSWRRTWQRLIWQERKRESFQKTLLVVGCLAGLAMSSLTGDAIRHFVMIYMLAIPLVMGLMAFEPSRGKTQGSFLISRGVSPAAVWLAKQAVWLPRAFWITGLIFFIAWSFERRHVPLSDGISEYQYPFQALYRRISSRPDLAVCYVLLSYGCGQLAATLLQSVILAGVLGIFLNVLVAQWQIGMDWLGVPLWWAWGIPIVTFPLITFWQMRPRMLDDQSWSRRFQLTGAMLAIPVVLVLSLAYFRVTEVEALPSIQSPDAASRWRSLAFEEKFSRSAPPRDEPVRTQLLNIIQTRGEADELADQIVELLGPDVEVVDVKLGAAASALDSLRSVIPGRAEEHLRAGERGRALDCYLASLKLARLLAMHEPLLVGWSKNSASQYQTLESLVAWANHPLQTPASIREAMRTIEAELNQFPAATDAIFASFVEDLKVADVSSMIQANNYVLERHLLVRHADELVSTIYFPWERARLKILMSREAGFLFERAWVYEHEPWDNRAEAVWENSVRSMMAQKRGQLFQQTYGTLREIRASILQRQTEIRAALVRMELIAYRMEHERSPSALIELLETNPSLKIVDPWSNKIFDYFPVFLLSAGSSNSALMPAESQRVRIERDETFKGLFEPAQLMKPSNFFQSAADVKRQSYVLGQVWAQRSVFPIPPEHGELVNPE